MVLRLSTRTPVEYETNLTRFIQNETRQTSQSILFLDCQSTLTNYLFSRRELLPVLNAVDRWKLNSMNQFLTLLQSVHFREKIQRARVLIVSPYYHLLGETSAFNQKKWLAKTENVFERIEEKFNVHVVVAEEG